MIAGITGVAPSDQALYYEGELMDDSRKMRHFKIKSHKHLPTSPAKLALCYRGTID